MKLWRKALSNLNRTFFLVVMSIAFLYLFVVTGQLFPLVFSLTLAIYAVILFRKYRRQKRRVLSKM